MPTLVAGIDGTAASRFPDIRTSVVGNVSHHFKQTLALQTDGRLSSNSVVDYTKHAEAAIIEASMEG